MLDMHQVKTLIENGWKPYRDRDYIVLRKGSMKRSVGRYTDELWRAVWEMYEQYAPRQEEGQQRGRSPVTSLLTAGLSKPSEVPGRIRLDLETLAYYEWVRTKGYGGSLSDFINDCVKLYFQEHGIRPMIVIGLPPLEYEVSLEETREGKWVAIERPEAEAAEEETEEGEGEVVGGGQQGA